MDEIEILKAAIKVDQEYLTTLRSQTAKTESRIFAKQCRLRDLQEKRKQQQ